MPAHSELRFVATLYLMKITCLYPGKTPQRTGLELSVTIRLLNGGGRFLIVVFLRDFDSGIFYMTRDGTNKPRSNRE